MSVQQAERFAEGLPGEHQGQGTGILDRGQPEPGGKVGYRSVSGLLLLSVDRYAGRGVAKPGGGGSHKKATRRRRAGRWLAQNGQRRSLGNTAVPPTPCIFSGMVLREPLCHRAVLLKT